MINAFAKVRSPDRAEQWFGRMLADGVRADAVSFTSVVDAFGKAGQVREEDGRTARSLACSL